jgi:hypothetical protein
MTIPEDKCSVVRFIMFDCLRRRHQGYAFRCVHCLEPARQGAADTKNALTFVIQTAETIVIVIAKFDADTAHTAATTSRHVCKAAGRGLSDRRQPLP